MQQIKGAVLKSRLAFVERQAGKPALEQVLATLPPDTQRTLRMLFTSNWYPFAIGKALDDAIVQVLGGGRPEFFEKLGEASAEKNLGATGVHRRFLVESDPRPSWRRRRSSTPTTTTRDAGTMRRPARTKRCSRRETPRPSALPTA